jgi:hypothetical protein
MMRGDSAEVREEPHVVSGKEKDALLTDIGLSPTE